MSQRIHSIEKDFTINIQVTVRLKHFSNHEGFKENQISNALEEFEDEISSHLKGKIQNEFYEEFLQSVDYVNYEVE